MTFRTRILLACFACAIVPLLILAAGARHVVRERLTDQYRERVSISSDAVRRGLTADAATIDQRLRTVEQRLIEEPGSRAALIDPAARPALLDLAPDAMRAAGLDHLLLLDEGDTVLSSGHFRNDYDRSIQGLTGLLRQAEVPSLIRARRPDGEFLALVRARSFEIGGRRLTLAGGIEVDSASVSRRGGGWSEALGVSLDYPGGEIGSEASAAPGRSVAEYVRLPFVDTNAATATAGEARWSITHSLTPLHAVTRGMDRWLVAALAAALLLAFIIARIMAARVTRPLEQLARSASRVELTRYDAQLATRRRDEIGSLSRLLDRMVHRLRTAAQHLREAERRATVGDMARQVNHDIRNGLLPIRNVIRHLSEVARDAPAELPSVFSERAGTLQGGIVYLENLATNYARLTPRTERQPCDVNALLRDMQRSSVMPDHDTVSLDLSPQLPPASADPVALRRVVENLVVNAVESLTEAGGHISLRTAANGTADDRRIVITVTDNGTGIAPADLDRIFDDFHTTKERGTGLGLSIVRRLVTDMGGRVHVQSEPGRGTTFTIELPAERPSGLEVRHG